MITGSKLIVAKGDPVYIEFQEAVPNMNRFATGDYYAVIFSQNQSPRRIIDTWERGVRIADAHPFEITAPCGNPG